MTDASIQLVTTLCVIAGAATVLAASSEDRRGEETAAQERDQDLCRAQQDAEGVVSATH